MSNAVVQSSGFALSNAYAPKNFSEAREIAVFLSQSGMIPFQFQGKPDDVLSAMMLGAELGLKPVQSLQNIAVINGRPSVFGDAVKAIIMASPICEGVEESFDMSDKKNPTAICVAKRKGQPEVTSKFSWADAMRAGLAGKSGPWTTYPMRMLQMRARSFALRDQFPDLLKGIGIYEEVIDIPDNSGGKAHSFGVGPEVEKDIEVAGFSIVEDDDSEQERAGATQAAKEAAATVNSEPVTEAPRKPDPELEPEIVEADVVDDVTEGESPFKNGEPKMSDASEPEEVPFEPVDEPTSETQAEEPVEDNSEPEHVSFDKMIEVICDRMGGKDEAEKFLHFKGSLRKNLGIDSLTLKQAERLYNNIDKMVEIQKQEVGNV